MFQVEIWNEVLDGRVFHEADVTVFPATGKGTEGAFNPSGKLVLTGELCHKEDV